MTRSDLDTLCGLVMAAGREELQPRFRRIESRYKQDGSLLTEADLAVQQRMQEGLRVCWPEIPLLGEEMSPAEQARVLATGDNGFWCLDPLDGTSNFAAGIPFYSISLALIRQGRPQLAVVYDPARDECFSAAAGLGAWCNDQRLSADDKVDKPLQRCTAIIDFKRLPAALAERIARHPPYASQRSFGSVALDWAWLADGRGQVYLHGSQKLWDYAAGWLILDEAGGVSSTLGGERGFVLSLEPRSAVAGATRAYWERWSGWLAAER